jgi:hypothetical protein
MKMMTNRDKFLLKLIDMSDKELANIYCISKDCSNCRFVGVKGCYDKIVDWIKQECESNDD